MKKNLYLDKILLGFLLCIMSTVYGQVLEADSLALVALYDSTDGANWTNHENWLTGPISSWYGITVSGDRVTEIILRENNLVGEIPHEIGDLTNLTRIHFYKNKLVGSIPAELGNLTNLQSLLFDKNHLEGSMPIELGNLTNLQSLNLAGNQLVGSIPVELGNLTNLKNLALFINQLVGSIPVELGNLTNLTNLALSYNQLEGSIPVELGNLTNLQRLNLGGNQLVGSFPIELSNLTNLENLSLFQNHLVGSIPVEITNLIKLEYLFLFSNKFTTLPDISSITTLKSLDIFNNKFTFEDIEPNIGIQSVTYSPQDSLGEKLDTTITAGATLTLTVAVGGTANQYQWMKDSVNITGATESSYTIDSAGASDAGTYICEITNTIATELTLFSREIKVMVDGTVGIEETENEIPTEYALYQNYPNPFNPTTTIKFAIPSVTSGFSLSKVTLKVYDILGKHVTTLINETKQPGVYEVNFNAKDLPSGVYIYRIRASCFVQSRKLLLMK